MATDRPPRSAAAALGNSMGVSEGYAKSYAKRLPPSEAFDALDAKLDALAAVADVEALESINDVDKSDIGEADDPEAMLEEMVQERSDRSLLGRIAAETSWARTEDRSERTRPGREAFLARFEREVDPEGKLDPRERAIRAEHLKKAHFARLALASSKARRKKAADRKR